MIWPNETSFDSIFRPASEQHAVPLSILKGVTAKESSFNPRASKFEPHVKDTSRGLMQVLYSTAKWIGFKGTEEELFDPAKVIPVGAAVLKRFFDMATKTGGGWEDAVSMYNAGMEKIGTGRYTARKRPDGTFLNQQYVDDVKVYSGYFAGKIPEETARRYMKTKILDVAIPALMVALIVGIPLLLLYSQPRPAL